MFYLAYVFIFKYKILQTYRKVQNSINTYTGIPHFIVLYKYCVFYRLKVCGDPVSSKSAGTIFPTALAHFLFLCHILVILAIFSNFFITIF